MSYEPLTPRPSRVVGQAQPTAQPVDSYPMAGLPIVQKEPRRGWRKMTWFILVVQVLFVIWLITGVSSAAGKAENCASLDQATCEAAQGLGTAIGAGLILVLWAVINVILLVIWLVTRPRQR